ncbi:MAG: ABC transporter substrate-binding protein, partial [Alphaproteobacteria bacterium]|nr:ABC transporter substrate-binding protein [Alphaproteobacteria bacterium]
TSPSNSKGQIFVNSFVPMDQGEPAKVVWRVLEKDGQYKIVDIIIENVSLAITARNEYTAFIKNNPGGIDALISNLKSKI